VALLSIIQNAEVQLYAQLCVGYAFTVTVATHELVTGPLGIEHLGVLSYVDFVVDVDFEQVGVSVAKLYCVAQPT
jgi:hypothetical protein